MKLQEIIIYGDSTSMPSASDSVGIADTWYWKLAMTKNLELRLENRSEGGATIHNTYKKILNDSPYFFPKGNLSNNQKLVIVQIGIVDAAIYPITHKLKIVNRLPVFGKYIWFVLAKVLYKPRPIIQKMWSFSRTSSPDFEFDLEKIIRFLTKREVNICVLLSPIPHPNLEFRSPGFRENVVYLNEIKLKVLKKYPRVFLVNLEEFRVSDYVSKEDGHHFAESGHEYICKRVQQEIKLES